MGTEADIFFASAKRLGELYRTKALSPVEATTAPNVTLGGGLIFLPSPRIKGTVTVFNSEESATENPFDHTDGTTFATEWTFGHTLGDKPGGQILGFLYGIDKNRADIAQDARVFIGELLVNQSIPQTDKDSWAFYYNAHQYVQGDSTRGWGPFIRFGFSDGDPNPVRWNIAGGVGGKGPFADRPHDRWGVGIYYIDMSDDGLLQNLNVDSEVGGEIFYNYAIAPALRLTLDAQVVDSARPNTDLAWLLAARLGMSF
jgi:porin